MGSIDITRMRRAVRKPLGMLDEDDPDLTNDDVELYLNRAYWEVQDKFPFREKERRGTFITQLGVRNYEMPKPFEALEGLSIVDPVSGQHTPLDYMDHDVYEGQYQEGANFYGTPQFYTRTDCYATLLPTPDKQYTINIRRKITLSDLSSANTLSALPQVWDEILIFGAVWRGFIDFGDFARANQMKAHQVSLLDTIVPTPAKEMGDTSRAGLEVLGREY